jgi:hypothetical protein
MKHSESGPLFLGLAKLDQQHTKHTSEVRVVRKSPYNGEEDSVIRLSNISNIDNEVPPTNKWEDVQDRLKLRPVF